MQNGYIERVNGSTEGDTRYIRIFEVYEARTLTMQWIEEYNTKRPHEGVEDATSRERSGKLQSPNKLSRKRGTYTFFLENLVSSAFNIRFYSILLQV